jgi:hypothetical protein
MYRGVPIEQLAEKVRGCVRLCVCAWVRVCVCACVCVCTRACAFAEPKGAGHHGGQRGGLLLKARHRRPRWTPNSNPEPLKP